VYQSKEYLCHESHGYPERRWLQFLVLRSVYEKPTYGYNIIKEIEKISYGRHKIKSGTMYTTLRRMEKDALLKSAWKKSKSGPDRREYSVTKKGEKHLKKWLEMIIERKKMVDKMVTFYYEHFGGDKV
jgi:DNA-binding PadR family transcriptional regulator